MIEIPPNCIFVKVDVSEWKSYLIFSGTDRYMSYEFPLEEFGETGDAIAASIAEAIQKGADVSRVMTQMKAEGKTIEDMDKMMAALAADGGL